MTRRTRSLLATLLVVVAMEAHPRLSSGQSDPQVDLTVPLLFSASGGVSKGSYQGGVDWTLAEYLSRQRDHQWRARVKASVRYEFSAATGASAGNIDALFAGLRWCTARAAIAPEDSLFWKAWVNTGLRQLFPRHASDSEFALFDRTFFEQQHRALLAAYLADSPGVSHCGLPVALTVTKLVPVTTLTLGGSVRTAVQRFAVAFRVATRRDGSGAWTVDFGEPAKAVQDAGSLGALALLPALAAGPREGGQAACVTVECSANRLHAVFEAVLASSSFPVAFAPRKFSYVPAGMARDVRVEGPDYFLDGGVFDNNPIGLAVRMYEVARGSGDHFVDVAYSSTSTLRASGRKGMTIETLESADPRGREQVTGVAATLKLILNATTSARAYEQQTFARDVSSLQETTARLALDDEEAAAALRRVTVHPWLLPSSRSSTIFGASLLSFGGFLGRSLREYDFYRGVYDGLRFVAEHLICREPPTTTEVRVTRPDCAAAAHRELVADDVFDVGPVGRRLLQWMMHDEYETGWSHFASGAASTDTEHRLAVLWRLHQSVRLRTTTDDAPCVSLKHYERLLCGGGLLQSLKDLRADVGAMTSVRALATECQARVGGVSCSDRRRECFDKAAAESTCSVDSGFAALIDDPVGTAALLSFRAAMRLQDIEESADDTPEKLGLPALTKPAVALYVWTLPTYGSRLSFNPIAGPGWDSEHRLSSTLAKIVPNYAEHCFGGCSLVLGYRPLELRSGRLYVSTLAELAFPGPGFAAGGGMGWRTRSLYLSSFELNASRMIGRSAFSSRAPGDWDWGAHATIRLAAERLKLTATVRSDGKTQWRLGLGDLNGWLFWLTRSNMARSTR